MSQRKKPVTSSEHLQRVEEAFRKAGFKALPADHPVYQDSAYNIRPVNIQPDYRRSAEKEMSDN